jgi:Spy/CpxP family protein refolding chaperone
VKFNWKKLSIVAGVAGAMFLTSALVVFSQNPPARPDGPPGPRGPFGHGPHGPGPGGAFGPQEPGPRRSFGPLHGLNLTDAQQEQIRQIHESFADQTRALRDQMRTLHENQTDPMAGDFNEATVRAAAEARAKLHVEQEVLHAKIMSQVANVLTPEQRSQLVERRKQRKPMGPPRGPAPPTEPQF